MGSSMESENEQNVFWDLLEYKIGFALPVYLKNILSMSGFDNPISFKRITEADIAEIEQFVLSDKMKKRIPKDGNLREYFGTFYENPEDFEIVLGHKKMLIEVIAFVQEKLNADGINSFNQFDKKNKGFSAFMTKKTSKKTQSKDIYNHTCR